MRRGSIWALAVLIFFFSAARLQSSPKLHDKRQSPADLELGGELAGLPPGSTRYITHDELLAMPQVNYTVRDDTNFTGSTKIRGVKLEDLARLLGAGPLSDFVVAICDDEYRASYPRSYMLAHHPVLVLDVNGQPPSGWPKENVEHKFDMGPYMISHPPFKPSYKILSHVDEAQIPWGVVRIEFGEEKIIFGMIAPRGPHAHDAEVQAGYKIAEQNCFRCHNAGTQGGKKSGRSWDALSAIAANSRDDFTAYIRKPLAKNPHAQMPANPQYDDATLGALAAYFRTFSERTNP